MALHFSIDKASFTQTTAHGGERPILTQRVLEKVASRALNFIDLTIVPPGSNIGLHTHTDDNEEIYILVSGTGTMLVDGERFGVAAGDVIVNRPGGTHAFWNTGTSDVRLVVIEAPVRAAERHTSASGTADDTDPHRQG